MKKPTISAIVAFDENRGIGLKNKIPWHIPSDLKHFKAITLGHPVIMGRKTYESIIGYLGKPLPDRSSIVVTRNQNYTSKFENVHIAHSLEEAIQKASDIDDSEIFVGGGEQLYKLALPYVQRLYLTQIHNSYEADSFFPDISEFKKEISREDKQENDIDFSWITLER